MKIRHTTLLLTPILIATVMAIASCARQADDTYDVFATQGAEAAEAFLRQYDPKQPELRTIDQLLEVQTSLTAIRRHDGDKAADAFRKGFEEYLNQHNDSLYNLIHHENDRTIP